MHGLRLNHSESAARAGSQNLEPFPFPVGGKLRSPSIAGGRWVPVDGALDRAQGTVGGPGRHPAEIAVERVQRRLDNLRQALGPDTFRPDDSPRAA